ncbi:histidinol-phosphate aminotransferase family protein [Patescibacteria group bacterium]|nr:histidinol-phosphate aminotransferase family protein [Patescibacteria group bacterium]
MIPLDRNESYWLLDDELLEAARGIGARELSTYPDYGELKSALARYADVAPEQILVTPGSDAAIEYIARAYAGSGGDVILPVPTFYGYESILDRVGSKIIPILYKEENGRFIFPITETINALAKSSAKVLFLCHPNNPLGCPLSQDDVSTLASALRGSNTIVVSDEAYFEFSSGASLLPHLAELPNLLIIRTLSKSFALSGARVGYIIADPDTIKKLEKLILPWPIAHPSAATALALLAQAEKVKRRRDRVIAELEHFREEMKQIPGVVVYPSETNFVLVRVPDAGRTREALLAQGIRVALGESMSRFPEAKKLLRDTLRIATPAPADRSAVIAAFSRLFTT